MIQQRKKDYLQKLIEEFFAKLQELINQKQAPKEPNSTETKELIDNCFALFHKECDIKPNDSALQILEKTEDPALAEQYSKLLLTNYKITEYKDASQLNMALEIVEYLENTDNTYSWDRKILKEDILRLLDT